MGSFLWGGGVTLYIYIMVKYIYEQILFHEVTKLLNGWILS